MIDQNLPMLPGEELAFQLEADMWNMGNNPIQRAIGTFMKTVGKFLGFKVKGHVSVTNKRVLVTSETIKCYVFKTASTTKVLNPTSILEVGYSRKAMFGLFCPTNFFYYAGHTDVVEIAVSGASEDQMKEYVNKFYQALMA